MILIVKGCRVGISRIETLAEDCVDFVHTFLCTKLTFLAIFRCWRRHRPRLDDKLGVFGEGYRDEWSKHAAFKYNANSFHGSPQLLCITIGL